MLIATAVSLGVGAPAAVAENPTVTIDQHRYQWFLDEAVRQVHDACAPHPDQDLTVRVRQPTYEFSVDIACSKALADPATFIKEPLVKEASGHQDAGKRARAVGDAYEALPPVTGIGYDHDSLAWGLAARDPKRCRLAENPENVQRNMSSAVQAGTDPSPGESPAHWTLVEAMWALGACPGRLPALYRSVAALGNPIAAQTVERIMAREPVELPLTSVPRGVSARVVAGRPVFLTRDGNHVSTFLAGVDGAPGGDPLWYCPKEHVFVSPPRAELFGDAGAIVDRPARRGLDRFATRVSGDTVTVHLDEIIHGSTTHATSPARAAAATPSGIWNTDPEHFCFQAVKNTITPFG